MTICVAKRDGLAQAEGEREEVIEVLKLLLKKGETDITWCVGPERASVCWGLQEP